MGKINKVLLMFIAMTAIMLLAAGIDKGMNYYEDKKWEKEREVFFEEARAEVREMQTTIETLSGDPEALIAYMEENGLNYVESYGEAEESGEPSQEEQLKEPENTGEENGLSEDILQEGMVSEEELAEGSVSDNGAEEETVSGNEPGGETVSDNMASEGTVSGNTASDGTVSDNAVSDNTASDGTVSDNTVSGNTASEDTVSDNMVPEGTVSGNTAPDSTVSDNTISGNTVSGNIVSGNIVFDSFISGNAASGNDLRKGRICASYEETIQINKADKEIIAGNSIDFSDVKIACLGDSVTAASNLDKLENYESMSYPAQLCKILNAGEVVNLGIGGSSIGRYWENAFVDRYSSIPEDTDIIIVMGGTNDGFCASEAELGSLEERKERTFAGDLDELLRKLKADYPNAQVILATPLPNVLHDMLRKDRSYLLPQASFVKIMKQLAEEYEVPVIDLYNSNLLDTHDAAVIHSFMPDGVHGNEMGYRILAEHIAAELIKIQEEAGSQEEMENREDGPVSDNSSGSEV